MEDVMYQKLNQIREIMEKTKEIATGKKSSQLKSGHNVVIVSALEEKDVQWLLRVLSSAHFHEQVINLNFINIMKTKEKNWEKMIAEYTFCIYVCNEYEWNQGASLTQRVKSLSAQGKENLVVVIDDAKVGSNEEKSRLLEQYPNINKYARGLFLFSSTEKESDYQKFLHSSLQPGPGNITRGSQSSISRKVVIGIRHKVGIFSRSGDRDYSWLMSFLTSETFRDHVLSIRPCLIFNNGYEQLNEDLSHCTFGILYHSKNRGRVNITDVTDSLYDEELQHLSMTLEKKNIMVIIDDVEDTSDQEKRQILFSQPKIADYANDLILISYEDRTGNRGQTAKSKILQHFLRLSDARLEYPPAKSGYENQRRAVTYPSLERSRYPPYLAPTELPPSSMGRVAPTPSRSAIGIFSRSDEYDYFWLRKLLTSEDSGHKDVLCYKISANDIETFREVAFKSKFGILYHSVKRGKIRLTDVKDSLYHQELEQLSIKLGKRKMIVVIDDLDNSRDTIKQKILEKQPSLGRLAADIFLFTVAEKKDVNDQSQSKHGSKMSKTTRDKISSIKKMLT